MSKNNDVLNDPKDEIILEIMLTLMDAKVLKFMCAPIFQEEKFNKFKAQLSKAQLSLLTCMNSKILNYFVGERQSVKTAFMQGIPSIYHEVNLHATEIVQYKKEHKIQSVLTRQDEVEAILFELSKFLEGGSFADYDERYISDGMWGAVDIFQKYLSEMPELIYTLVNHLDNLNYFAAIYAGETPDHEEKSHYGYEDDNNSEEDEPSPLNSTQKIKAPVPVRYSAHGSASSSSSFASTTSTSRFFPNNSSTETASQIPRPPTPFDFSS